MSGETPLTVPAGSAGMRLDLFLLQQQPHLGTRADIQRHIRDRAVTITGKRVVKPSTILHAGQVIQVSASHAGSSKSPVPSSKLPELKILHEDPQLIVLDKPAGVPVHPGVKREPTLADALLARYPALRNVGNDPARAGVVHRLDKDTSGVLLVARTPEMYAHLKGQFQLRRIRKAYVALVQGVVTEEEGTVKLPIVRSKRNPLRRTIATPGEGKAAETSFRVRERFREHTLLDVFPRTGRMHQIRVHLAHLGFPVAGDPLYGRKSHHRTPPDLRRQFLHATALAVTLPNGKLASFEGPLPPELADVLDRLRAGEPAPAAKPVRYRWQAPRSVR